GPASMSPPRSETTKVEPSRMLTVSVAMAQEPPFLAPADGAAHRARWKRLVHVNAVATGFADVGVALFVRRRGEYGGGHAGSSIGTASPGWAQWSTPTSMVSSGSERRALPSASEKVGNWAIVSSSTASGISARMARTAWWIHSLASGATAHAPTSTP